jgi:hypothetical protein
MTDLNNITKGANMLVQGANAMTNPVQTILNSLPKIDSKWVSLDKTKGVLTLNNYLEMENAKSGNQNELKLFKGTKFGPTPNGNLKSQDVTYQYVQTLTGKPKSSGKGKIIYWCSKGKFQVEGGKDYYYGEDFLPEVKQAFTSLCVVGPKVIEMIKKASQQTSDNKKATSSGGYTIQNSYTIGNGAIKIAKGDVVSKYGNNAVIKRGNQVITSFDCTTGKFNTRAGQMNVDNNKTILSTTIKSKFCAVPATSSASTQTQNVTANVGSNVSSNTGTATNVRRSSSRTTQYNKQIQTSLGIDKPTGTITDTELDSILSKL